MAEEVRVPADTTENTKFDYMLANPPFGVEWKKVRETVEDERLVEYWQALITAAVTGEFEVPGVAA